MKLRTWVHGVIDVLMFLCIGAVAGIGILIEHVLPQGRERMLEYGSNVHQVWLGLDRREWAEVHVSLGGIFLMLMVFHIVLHWEVLKCRFRTLVRSGTVRTIIAVLLLLASIALIAFPLIARPETVGDGSGAGRGFGRGAVSHGRTGTADYTNSEQNLPGE